MNRKDYFSSPRGRRSQLRKRVFSRFFATVNQAPQSKNIKTNDAIAFQQKILRVLGKKRAYRGPLLLQMEFFNQSKTPPAIHTLPKNYLDLLGKPRRDARIGRTALLYDDDRQVKALIVRYHLEPVFGTPQIWIRAE